MKKKLVVLNTTIMLGLGAFAIPSVDAASLNSQKAQIKKQRQDVQSSLSKADQQLTALLEERAVLDAQVKRVLQAISDNNNLIGKTQKDIVTTKAEVEQLKADIAVIQERIDKRNEILKERAIAYQENGNSKIGYVEVLLGSTSFGDFIERVGAVTKIVEADQDIIAQHDADKKEVEEKKTSVENKLSDLESMKVELEGMRAQMEEQKQQNDQLVNELNVKEKEVAALKASLKIQDSTLASKEAEIQAKLAAASYNYTPPTKAPVKTNTNFVSNNTNTNTNVPSKEVSAPEATENEQENNDAPVVKGDVNTVIKAGYKYFGNSVYVFGGGRTASDIANGRFDCSGFVSWAYSQAGVKLPAYTESLKGVGRQVSSSDMRPGDLVFFDTYKKDGHVGIYIGGGKFIGSQSSTGVAIANMSSGYWQSKFNGRVIRIF
ncbi:C40 family peptidase [Bacillus sp. S/N-304-OC-R1]|uniref:coiled-coil domain-containing protein n=1 Tax=Bacillus sp. S/N-304-OC-R1 TaxID=2758034 RepID=UPI001C8E4320|nr:C40 family peptidase [Bacillus sp. S/N-304-OC-R1]MBY0121387.1 C40 family peptidase [Bacillus sp. S/N-304-OC-R1]